MDAKTVRAKREDFPTNFPGLLLSLSLLLFADLYDPLLHELIESTEDQQTMLMAFTSVKHVK